MQAIPLILAATLAIGCGITGCQSPRAGSPSTSVAGLSTRDNCYSLLYQLLNDEKNVDLLRFIKREERDVNKLIRKIAAYSAATAKRLEEMARDDTRLNLKDVRLPSGEVATRDAIAATKKKELLGKSGDDFELNLLLSQAEALSYGWHLAKVAAENEPQPERARALAGVSADMQSLYQEVFRLMLSRRK